MALPKLPSSEKLWERHEDLVLNVFTLALMQLRTEENVPDAEDRINETLFIRIKRVWKTLPANEKPLWGPSLESQNQPRTDNDVGAKWIRKRPDFQWQFVDPSDSTELGFKVYVIECKRLGLPLEKRRVINEEYLTEGILRFITWEHSYGKGATSGAMIGYLQNMTLGDVLNDVNRAISNNTAHRIPRIVFSEDDFPDNGVIKTSQQLTRPQVPPSPFDLRHLWVDLRQ